MTDSPLMSADELRSVLDDGLDDVTVLDVRYRLGRPAGPDEFAAGHIPGAAYVDLDHDLADPPGSPDGTGGRHPLPEPFRFVGAMRAAGVGNQRRVVVYDDWQGRAAARAWWLLRHYGHRDVRVLDGGWAAWQSVGGETSSQASAIAPGDFAGAPGHLRTLDADDVPGFDGILIDARSPERYRGDLEPVDPMAGHIPGAINVPTAHNVDERGRFRSARELSRIYPTAEVAIYCGSGVTAAHDVLAMAIQGRDASLYPGSWSEWVNPAGPDRPVATG